MAIFEPPPTVDIRMLLPQELRATWAVVPSRTVVATWIQGFVLGLGVAGSVYGHASGDDPWKPAVFVALVALWLSARLPGTRRAEADLRSWWAAKAP